MLRPNEKIAVLFAGAGGADVGIRDALGRDPDIAINHDPIAIAMHQANFPNTTHFTQDVWNVEPRVAARGKKIGLLWASPDCTHHSRAKNGQPTRDKQLRDLPWVIAKWAEQVKPRLIFLENVPEFEDWGPLDKDGRPIREQKGQTFRTFLWKLRSLGYQVEHRNLRACDFGAPTSRERLFLIARRDGLPIVWPEATHGPGREHPYRTAAECIDWSIPCYSIFLTEKQVKEMGLRIKRPLKEATLRRIAKGTVKFVIENQRPFILPIQHYNGSNTVHSIDEPLRTITAQPKGGSFALVTAFLVKYYGGVTGTSLSSPVVCHLDRQFTQSAGAAVDEPVGAIMAGGGGKTDVIICAGAQHFGLIGAFLVKYYSNGGQLCNLIDPIHTITATDRMGLVTVNIDDQSGIWDILMRMLTPRELFLAQGFPKSFIIDDIEYNSRPISKRNQVHLVGNSVPPQVAAALAKANVVAGADADAGKGRRRTVR